MGAEGVAGHWQTKASGQSKFYFEDNLKVAQAGHTPTGRGRRKMDPSGYLCSPLAASASSLLRYANLSAKKRSKKTQINENFERRALYIEYYIVCICKLYIKKCQRQIRKQKQQQQTVGSNLGKRLPDPEQRRRRRNRETRWFFAFSAAE